MQRTKLTNFKSKLIQIWLQLPTASNVIINPSYAKQVGPSTGVGTFYSQSFLNSAKLQFNDSMLCDTKGMLVPASKSILLALSSSLICKNERPGRCKMQKVSVLTCILWVNFGVLSLLGPGLWLGQFCFWCEKNATIIIRLKDDFSHHSIPHVSTLSPTWNRDLDRNDDVRPGRCLHRFLWVGPVSYLSEM